MKLKVASTLILASLLVSSCGSGEEETEELQTQSAESGVAAAFNIANSLATQSVELARPTAPLGVFISSFLAQGTFVSVASATDGIEAHVKLLQGQNAPTASETFALLTELGTIMQVDIPDMLNRSTDRAAALNEYTASLKAAGEVAQRKQRELEIQEEQLSTERREQRDAANKIQRTIDEAFRNEDYTTAAEKQEELTEAQSELAQTETKLGQTSDIIKRYKDLLAIAAERLEALIRNREILIAGLKVTDMPGIDNFDILDQNKDYRRSRGGNDDVFGTDFLN